MKTTGAVNLAAAEVDDKFKQYAGPAKLYALYRIRLEVVG
jgi:hypothetical protein